MVVDAQLWTHQRASEFKDFTIETKRWWADENLIEVWINDDEVGFVSHNDLGTEFDWTLFARSTHDNHLRKSGRTFNDIDVAIYQLVHAWDYYRTKRVTMETW